MSRKEKITKYSINKFQVENKADYNVVLLKTCVSCKMRTVSIISFVLIFARSISEIKNIFSIQFSRIKLTKNIVVKDLCCGSFGRIERGALCQIVAPLSPGFGSTEQQLIEAVREFGLTPLINTDIYNVSGPDPTYPWYSNSDVFRAKDLASAILNPDVEVKECVLN